MRRWTALLLAIVVLLSGTALCEEARFVFRDGVTWDLFPEDVLLREGDPEHLELWINDGLTRMISIGDCSAAGVDGVTLTYCFIGDALVLMGYDFTGLDIDFDTLSRALTQVYGEPVPTDEARQAEVTRCWAGKPYEGVRRLESWRAPQGTAVTLVETDSSLLLDYVDESAALGADLLPPDGVWGQDLGSALASMHIDAWSAEEQGNACFLYPESNSRRIPGPFPTLVFADGALVMTMRGFDADEYNIDTEALVERISGRYGEPVDPDPARLYGDLAALGVPFDEPGTEEPDAPVFYHSWEGADGTYAVLTNLFEDITVLAVVGERAIPRPEPTPVPVNTDGL